MRQKNIHDCYFNLSEAAAYMSRSIRWFQYRLRGPNPPPGFKLGRNWVFKKSEIDRWLEQFRAGVNIDKIVTEVLADM